MQLHQLPLCMLSLLSLTSALLDPNDYARVPDPALQFHRAPAQAPKNHILHARDSDPFAPLHARGIELSKFTPDPRPTCFGDGKEFCEKRCACRKENSHIYCDKEMNGRVGESKNKLMRQRLAFCAPACSCEKEGKKAEGSRRDQGVFGAAAF